MIWELMVQKVSRLNTELNTRFSESRIEIQLLKRIMTTQQSN